MVTRCLQDITLMDALAQYLLNHTLLFTSMSEDCLYLNIYTPAHTHEGSNLPVSARPQRASCGKTFLL